MSKKRKQKHEETTPMPEAAEPQTAPEGEQGPETTAVEAKSPKPKGRKSKASKRTEAKQPRAEREAVLDLEPAADIKPLRAGTHLAHVVELTARPEGATAVELDKAIVTTAKSVKHYGIWALRYPLHKQKGFGFRSVHPDEGPARYHLVLPKGRTLEAYLVAPAAERKKAPAPKAEPVVRRTNKASKGHGKKASAARA